MTITLHDTETCDNSDGECQGGGGNFSNISTNSDDNGASQWKQNSGQGVSTHIRHLKMSFLG
jgi:hypothetical protein